MNAKTQYILYGAFALIILLLASLSGTKTGYKEQQRERFKRDIAFFEKQQQKETEPVFIPTYSHFSSQLENTKSEMELRKIRLQEQRLEEDRAARRQQADLELARMDQQMLDRMSNEHIARQQSFDQYIAEQKREEREREKESNRIIREIDRDISRSFQEPIYPEIRMPRSDTFRGYNSNGASFNGFINDSFTTIYGSDGSMTTINH